jgi:integrin alpha FG-GAP repeat containing protein 1
MGSINGIKMLVKKTTNTAEYEVLSSTQTLNMPNNELNMPYVIFGLGQITNYLEDFTLGYGLKNENVPESKDFTPIIPNSKLIIYTPSQNENNWELEILLNPNNAMLMILISTICVLFVLGIIILALYCKESKKDKQKDAINMATFTPW